MNLASTRRNWPTGRGFERFYGFLGAETNQWYPDLVHDNHPVDPPRTPGGGLPPQRRPDRQGDRVHRGRQGDRPRQAVLPLLRARAPPRAAPRAAGSGSTATRAGSTWATRRCASRSWPGRRSWASSRPTPSCRRSTRSARPRPAPGPNGEPFPPLDYTRPWDALSADEQRLFARMAEVYAGFLAHADAPDRPAARLPRGDRPAARTRWSSSSPTTAPAARAARTARSTRTSSSTASPTTSPRTSRCSTSSAARRPTTTTRPAGRWRSTRRSRCGSATSSTAARRDPCIISWPAGIDGPRRDPRPVPPRHRPRPDDAGRARRRAARDDRRATRRARSTASACATASTPPTLPSARTTQFYSMLGSRGIWHDGWKAVTTHPTISGWGHFDDDTWELYHTDVDRSELHDLAARGAREAAAS